MKMWFAPCATNYKPNEYKKSTKCFQIFLQPQKGNFMVLIFFSYGL
jgi:hypothetical protein